MWRAGVRLFAFIACLTVAGRGAAEPSRVDTDAAKAAFRSAERAFADARYAGALELFRLAFEKAPRDEVRFNLGVCLELLGRFSEARREFQQAGTSTTLSDAQRTEASKRALALADRTAEISVSNLARGAALAVDGVPQCAAPCHLFVEPGRHRITAKIDGAEAATELEVAGGSRVEVTLQATQAAPAIQPPQPIRAPVAAPAQAEPRASTSSFGWLTVTGAVAAGLGAAGVVGFGLHTRSLEDEYQRSPSASLRDEGLRTQSLTNVSLAVMATGTVLVALDLLLLKTAHSSTTSAAHPPLQFEF